MPLVPSNMDGFQILKILLVAKTKDYHNLPKKSFYTLILVDKAPFTPIFLEKIHSMPLQSFRKHPLRQMPELLTIPRENLGFQLSFEL